MSEFGPEGMAFFAWGVYGILFTMNFLFYSDLMYDRYTMSKYGADTGLAFRTWFGAVTWIRNMISTAVYGLGIFIWGLCFTEIGFMIDIFNYFIYFLNFIEATKYALMVVFWCLSLILDPTIYATEYDLYPYFHE